MSWADDFFSFTSTVVSGVQDCVEEVMRTPVGDVITDAATALDESSTGQKMVDVLLLSNSAMDGDGEAAVDLANLVITEGAKDFVIRQLPGGGELVVITKNIFK